MAWTPKEIAALKELKGVYRLPEGCWAILTVKDKEIPHDKATAWPEGVEYAWAVLMPGNEPETRGPRMAGVDNADDAPVREKCKANPSSPQHRAHEHKADWKRTKTVNGQEWPLAGAGSQLASPPANPVELWKECMRSLEELFEDFGLPVPTEEELLEAKMTEEDFLRMKQGRKNDAKGSGSSRTPK